MSQLQRSRSGAPEGDQAVAVTARPSRPRSFPLSDMLTRFVGMTARRQDEQAAEPATFSVLLIAPTGHGKSTLVNSVHQLLVGGDAPKIHTGANKPSLGRCTSDVTFTDIPARSLLFNELELIQPSERKQQEKLEEQVREYQCGIDDLLTKNIVDLSKSSKEEMDLFWSEEQDMGEGLVEDLLAHRDAIQTYASTSNYKAEVCQGDDILVSDKRVPVNLRWIDTPGLDDTFGQDDKILKEVLTKLCDWNTVLLATVCVVRSGVPNGDGFFKTLQRYWRQFKPFQNNWIFIHTGWDPHADYDYRGGATFESACALRKAALIVDLANHLGVASAELVNCEHIFIENGGLVAAKRVAPRNKPIQELLKMEQAKNINKLHAAIFRNSPVKVGELPFEKSDQILSMDMQLLEIVRAWTIIVADRLTVCKDRLEQEEKKLEEYRQVSEVVLNNLPTDAAGFWFSRRVEKVTLEVPLPRPEMLEHVQTSAVPLHRHWLAKCVDEGVSLERNGNTSKAVWKPTLSSPPLMGFRYALKLTATGEVWHRREIEELDGKISRLNETLTGLRSASDALKRLEVDMNQQSQPLQLWCSDYDLFYDWYRGEDGRKADQTTILERYGKAMHLPPGYWRALKSPSLPESTLMSTAASSSAAFYNIADDSDC